MGGQPPPTKYTDFYHLFKEKFASPVGCLSPSTIFTDFYHLFKGKLLAEGLNPELQIQKLLFS